MLGLDGQQFDGCHAEVLQIGERGRMGEAGIGAAQFRRKPWGVRGESFDVQFVDDGFAPWHMRVGWFSHMLVDVAVVNGHGNRHVSQRVHGAHRSERRTGDLAVFDLAFVGEGARVEFHLAFDAFGVWVEQQFVWIEAHAMVWIPWAVDAVSVLHAVPCLRHVHVPQSVVGTVHAEQCFAKIERGNASGADALFFGLIDERESGFVEQPCGVGIEGARLVKWFKYAKPHLVCCF